MELTFPAFAERLPWRGPDLQTLRNYLVPQRDLLAGYPAERLELPLKDGSGDRLAARLNRPLRERGRPLIILIHGLTGCELSPYIVNSAAAFLAEDYPVLRLNLRGAGPSRPLCRLLYHAGRTADVVEAVAALPSALTAAGIVAMGFSLGGNVMLKLLGECGKSAPFKAAIAVSAPIDLLGAARRLMAWRNRFYQGYLLRHMRAESTAAAADLTQSERRAIAAARSVWEFDHEISAPRSGFAHAEDYYRRSSAQRFLAGIAVPTLIVQALDDPWIPAEAYEGHDWRRNPCLFPVLSRRGGHVGFQGRERRPWHDLCALNFLAAVLSAA